MKDLDLSCSDVYDIAMPPYYITILSVFVFWLGLTFAKKGTWILQPCISCCMGDSESEEGSLGAVDYFFIFQLLLNCAVYVYSVITLFDYDVSAWDRYQLLALYLSQSTFPAIFVTTVAQSQIVGEEKFYNPETPTEYREYIFHFLTAAILIPVGMTHTLVFMVFFVPAFTAVVFCIVVLMTVVYCFNPEAFDHLHDESGTPKGDAEDWIRTDPSMWSWARPGFGDFQDLKISLWQLSLVQVYFGVAIPWIYLLYRGHPVLDIPSLDFNARTTECYFNTMSSSVPQQVWFTALF